MICLLQFTVLDGHYLQAINIFHYSLVIKVYFDSIINWFQVLAIGNPW